MILTYSLFALAIMVGGMITALGIIRGGHSDSQSMSPVLYIPEDHHI